MTVFPTRRRVRKIALLLIAPPVLPGLSGWIWVDRVAERQWASMDARTQVLLAEWERRDFSRPVLRGEPLEGNSRDDYAEAEKKLEKHAATLKRPLPGDPTVWSNLERSPKA